jgi:hypothetical protein
MSNDIAALYIRIDSTGAVTASKDLASLDTAAAKVEGSTKKVETATASASRSFGQMATAVKALAASYAVLKMAQYVKEVTMLAARYETLGVVMRIVGNNAGYSGAQMAAFARGLEKTGISMVEARQSLTRMVQANLDLAQSSKLARVAQDAAVIGNINSSEAFQRMVYGIQSGQVEILRTIGINVNFENSYQKVAKATGRVTTQLSEAEKSQIRMNAVMDAGKMIAGTYEAAMGTAGKQVLSLQRHLDNLKVAFGLAFTPVLAEIIETITGAITDLNGELSGDSKDKITAWGVNFRIALIDIQAEIRRLAMLLDKLGGTMTSAQMLLYGPGRALGVKSSTERFERAADANIGYEARYNASDKELERLMAKRIQLEQSLTAEGKASAEAAQDATEKKVLAAQRAAAATGKEVEADEKAVKAAQKFREEANKINETLGNDIKMSGLDDLEKKLFEIQIKYEKLGKNPLVDKGLLGKARGIEESAAISEANQKITESNKKMYEELKKGKEEYEALLADLQGAALKGHEKALHEISKAEEEVYKKIEKLLDEAKISWEQAELLFKLTGNKTEKSTADETVRSTQFEADYYSQIEGYAQQAYEKKLKLIELERQANIDLYKDNAEAAAAANAKANQDRIKAYSEKIDADQKWTKTVIGNFGSMLDAAKECYDEDSSEYNRLNDMKKAVLFAQLAMEAVKNVRILAGIRAQTAATVTAAGIENAANSSKAVTGAVAAIATQGSGDPYTAFARIAAMIALMTSVLAMAGIAFSGGGGGSSSAAASGPSYGQDTTVLGGANGQASESITKVFELLQDTYDMEETKFNNLYSEMKNLNRNITGVVKSVVLGDIGNMTEGQLAAATPGWKAFDEKYFGSWIAEMDQKFMDAIGNIPIIGGVLGNIVSSLVGGSGGEKSLKASGIRVKGGAVNPYNIVHTAGVNSSWGFGGSDEYDTRIDRKVDDSLTAFFYGPNGLSATTSKMFYDVAGGLGKDADAAAKVITDAFLNMGDINLIKAKTPEKIQKVITDRLSKLEDVAARSIFGDEYINKYIKVNEGAAETIFRLYIDLESVNSILDMTTKSTISRTVDLAESLIELAGGLDKLQESATNYYNAFFNDKEKQEFLKSQLSEALSYYGMDLPGTRSGYRALVESQTLSTEQGAARYAELLMLAETADKYYKYIEKAAETAKGSLKPEHYSTNLEYQRALAGLQSFDNGGMSVGPESGYVAQLHGTELIVSPRNSYPATVKGLSNDEVVAEIRGLRKDIGQGNFYSKANSDKITSILNRWEGSGLPETRT